MLTPSQEIIQLLSTFAPALTAPTFANALVLIYGTILGVQIFTPAYVLAGGTSGGGAYTTGPENSLLFYVFYLYKSAFQYSDMGYAAALAWVLFVISVVLSFAILRWSRQWVHYEGA